MDGMLLIQHIDDEALSQLLGVQNILHRKKIVDGIKSLQDQHEEQRNQVEIQRLKQSQEKLKKDMLLRQEQDEAARRKAEAKAKAKAKAEAQARIDEENRLKAQEKESKKSKTKSNRSQSSAVIYANTDPASHLRANLQQIRLKRELKTEQVSRELKRNLSNQKAKTWGFEYTGSADVDGLSDHLMQSSDKMKTFASQTAYKNALSKEIFAEMNIIESESLQRPLTAPEARFEETNRPLTSGLPVEDMTKAIEIPSYRTTDEILEYIKTRMYLVGSRLVEIEKRKINAEMDQDSDLARYDDIIRQPMGYGHRLTTTSSRLIEMTGSNDIANDTSLRWDDIASSMAPMKTMDYIIENAVGSKDKIVSLSHDLEEDKDKDPIDRKDNESLVHSFSQKYVETLIASKLGASLDSSAPALIQGQLMASIEANRPSNVALEPVVTADSKSVLVDSNLSPSNELPTTSTGNLVNNQDENRIKSQPVALGNPLNGLDDSQSNLFEQTNTSDAEEAPRMKPVDSHETKESRYLKLDRLELVFQAFVNQQNNGAHTWLGSNSKLTRLKFFGGIEKLLKIHLTWPQFDILWTRLDWKRSGDLDVNEFRNIFGSDDKASHEHDRIVLREYLYELCEVLKHAKFTMIELFQSFQKSPGSMAMYDSTTSTSRLLSSSYALTLSDFCSLLRTILGSKVQQKAIYRVVNVLDQDGNHRLSLHEIMVFVYSVWKQELGSLSHDLSQYEAILRTDSTRKDIDQTLSIEDRKIYQSLQRQYQTVKDAIRRNFPRDLRDQLESQLQQNTKTSSSSLLELIERKISSVFTTSEKDMIEAVRSDTNGSSNTQRENVLKDPVQRFQHIQHLHHIQMIERPLNGSGRNTFRLKIRSHVRAAAQFEGKMNILHDTKVKDLGTDNFMSEAAVQALLQSQKM